MMIFCVLIEILFTVYFLYCIIPLVLYYADGKMNSREESWYLTLLDESQQHQAGATLEIAYNRSPDRHPHSVKSATSYFIHQDAVPRQSEVTSQNTAT